MTRDHRMTVDELLALPPTVDIPTAGSALGLSRTKSYQMFQSGQWPIDDVPVLRLGKRFKVPTAPLLRYLGIERTPHTTDTRASASGGGTTDAPAMRRSINPGKRYRLRSGEVVTGAEILRKRGQA